MWLFYSGLVDFEKAPEKQDVGNHATSYAFESQQKIFCDGVVKGNNSFIHWSGTDILSLQDHGIMILFLLYVVIKHTVLVHSSSIFHYGALYLEDTTFYEFSHLYVN